MKIWAISDLHLGFSTGKWMDRFGPHWAGHAGKVEEAWRERVGEGDIVLVPGDLSWAMKADEVRADLAWLAALPGRKVLIKGNHDYWWPPTGTKMQALLPQGIFAMKKKALVIDGVPLIGVRGCDFPPPPGAGPGFGPEAVAEAERELGRERVEFQASIDHLKTLGPVSRPPIALFHHPPFPQGESESPFTAMVDATGARTCIYGHLHTQTDWERTFQGEFRGVTYRLVSCDFLGFRPILIEEIFAS
jgi:predicted phosphohydrolase